MITKIINFTEATICTEQMFMEIIRSKKVKEICAKVQKFRTLEEEAREAGNEEKTRYYHDRANKEKNKLPGFCYQATFPSGKRSNEDAQPNGLVIDDIDNIKGEIPQYSEDFCKEHDIVLLHITPSGRGLRVVFKGDHSKTYVENQRAMAELLGLELDEACKDKARISYAVPEENIIFLDSELFTYYNPLPEETEEKQDDDEYLSLTKAVMPVKKAPLEYKGVSYDSIIKKWWEQNGGEPIQGERNSKLSYLAFHLRYLCDNDPVVLLQVMDSYGLPQSEMKAIVKSACKNTLHFTMPKKIRQVLAACGIKVKTQKAYMTREENQYWTRRLLDINHPMGIKESINSVADSDKMNALLDILPILYTLATGIAYKIWDGQWYRMSGTTVLIGPASSGKSFFKALISAWMKPLKEADAQARQIENEYKAQREAAGQMEEIRPKVNIRIVPSTISTAQLHERMANARRTVWNVPHTQQFSQGLHLLTVDFEFSTVVKAQKQTFSSYRDLMVKSHQDEEVGVDYRIDSCANGIRNIHWNQVFAGNMADFQKLFPYEEVQNGMPLRLMIGFIPENSFQMNNSQNSLSAHDKAVILEVAKMLDGLSGNVDVSPLSDYMYKWSQKKAAEMQKNNDIEGDFIRRRCGSTIGMRAGIISAVIRNAPNWEKLPIVVLNEQEGMLEEDKEYARQLTFTEDDFKLAELIADYCFEQQYKLFKEPLERAAEQNDTLSEGIIFPQIQQQKKMTAEDKYNLLPDTFTKDDVERIYNVSTKRARNICGELKSAGKASYNRNLHNYSKTM